MHGTHPCAVRSPGTTTFVPLTVVRATRSSLTFESVLLTKLQLTSALFMQRQSVRLRKLVMYG